MYDVNMFEQGMFSSRFERALVSDVGACVVAICKGVAFHFL